MNNISELRNELMKIPGFKDVYVALKKQLSYSGDFDKEFMENVLIATFNESVAKEIFEYYIKHGITPILQEDGIIRVHYPHWCRVRGFGGMDYLHQYDFHGVVIFPANEKELKLSISPYNSKNGWRQNIGYDFETSCGFLEDMENRYRS